MSVVNYILTGALRNSKQLCSTQYNSKYNVDLYEVYVNKYNFIHAKSFNKNIQNTGTVNSDLILLQIHCDYSELTHSALVTT